jgi:hypothetical protein
MPVMMFLLETPLSSARPHLETLIGCGQSMLSTSVLCKPEGNAASSEDQGSSLSFLFTAATAAGYGLPPIASSRTLHQD